MAGHLPWPGWISLHLTFYHKLTADEIFLAAERPYHLWFGY